MADEAAPGSSPMMASPLGPWLIGQTSRALEADEREAVLGDFVESGTTGWCAIHELLGLIARRQAAPWRSWRPWFVLVALVVPLGFALSLVSRFWAAGNAIYLWLYFSNGNWTWGYLDSPGARRDLFGFAAQLCLSYLALAAWSWTGGFVLGSFSRRAAWLNAALFGLALFAGTVGTTTTAAANHNNAAVFSDTFYRAGYPLMVRLVLVVWPAFQGVRASFSATFSFRGAVTCAVGVAVLTALTSQSLASSLTFGWLSKSAAVPIAASLSHGRFAWSLGLFPLILAWPAAFILASASWRRRNACVP